jgi:hypothetical protein
MFHLPEMPNVGIKVEFLKEVTANDGTLPHETLLNTGFGRPFEGKSEEQVHPGGIDHNVE